MTFSYSRCQVWRSPGRSTFPLLETAGRAEFLAVGAQPNINEVMYAKTLNRHPGSPLFDHFVGTQQERFRNREAYGFCGFEVDDQLKFTRLQYWKIGRLFALEDATDVNT